MQGLPGAVDAIGLGPLASASLGRLSPCVACDAHWAGSLSKLLGSSRLTVVPESRSSLTVRRL